MLLACSRSSNRERSCSIALRSRTSAEMGSVSATIVAMKACRSSSDSLSLPITNGPVPRTVVTVAIVDRTTTAVATSR
jgi:hypothetical protein